MEIQKGRKKRMNKNKKRRIAILTGGGDCPGINAVIRAITKKAILEHDMEVIGIKDGYEGLIHNQYRYLSYDDVSGILTLGGTILGTTNKANPFQYAVKEGKELKYKDFSSKVFKNIEELELNALSVSVVMVPCGFHIVFTRKEYRSSEYQRLLIMI